MNLLADISSRDGHDAVLPLMARVAAGDAQAQARLAARILERVRRTCYVILRHGHDAEDATQSSLIEVLKSAHLYRVDTSLEAWTDRIAARTALRMARQRSRRWHLFGTLPEDAPEPAANLPFAGQEDARSAWVRGCLDRLPEKRRQAFVLKHVLGYTVEEISALLASNPGTIKDRLFAARKQLRAMMGAPDERGGAA